MSLLYIPGSLIGSQAEKLSNPNTGAVSESLRSSDLKLKPIVKTLFLEALKSGKYKPGEGALRVKVGWNNQEEERYCCLGVLEECAILEGAVNSEEARNRTTMIGKQSASFPSRQVREWAHLSDNAMYKLAELNDAAVTKARRGKKRATYAAVIKYIEENL